MPVFVPVFVPVFLPVFLPVFAPVTLSRLADAAHRRHQSSLTHDHFVLDTDFVRA